MNLPAVTQAPTGATPVNVVEKRALTGSTSRLDRLTGTIIAGKFYILEQLGEGGMGQVYKARHLSLDKLVCVKILRPQYVTNSTVVTRFEREAKSASRLNHPNSIQVLDFGSLEKGNGFYIVMEYIEGRDLATIISDEWPLPEMRTCHIIGQVLSALAAARLAQVIHRDLKPENIMLQRIGDDPDFVKVLDFGIAKVMAADQPGLTRGDLVTGTPQYMSPEQATGAPIDGRSDLYAIGVILYRMVTGFLPFEARNPMEYLTKHATEKPVRPRLRRPDASISPELESLILRTLEKDPAKRPQTAEEFRKEILQIEAARRMEARGQAALSAGQIAWPESALAMDDPDFPSGAASPEAPTEMAPSEPAEWSQPQTTPQGTSPVTPSGATAPTSAGTAAAMSPAAPVAPIKLGVTLANQEDLSTAVAAYKRRRRWRFVGALVVLAAMMLGAAAVAQHYIPLLTTEQWANGQEKYDRMWDRIATALRRQALPVVASPAAPGTPAAAAPVKKKPRAVRPPVAAVAPAVVDAGMVIPPPVVLNLACPEGAVLIPDPVRPFCIDQYEFPNQRGVAPSVWRDWSVAQESCRGLGKRLCTSGEWTRACFGRDGAYSMAMVQPGDRDGCIRADAKGHRRTISTSGTHKHCVSPYGVADMIGNAGEWTSSPAPDDPEKRLIMGGSAGDTSDKTTCSASEAQPITAHGELVGFRCCADPTTPQRSSGE